jgi:hypothetical protein
MLPLRIPAALGVKATWTVHPAPAATEAQSFVSLKSPAAVTLLTVSVLVPVLVNATACAAVVMPTVSLPKLMLDGVRLMPGDAPMPVSARTTCPAPDPTVYAITAVPVRGPVAVGVNVTLTLQEPPGATAPVQ